MADEKNVIKSVAWEEIFSFPQIFKSFKMGIHPSKLILALVAIALLFAGGKVMDTIWGWGNGTVQQGTILKHASTSPEAYDKNLEKWEDSRLEQAASLKAQAKNNRHNLNAYMSNLKRSSYLQNAFAAKLKEYNKDNENESDPNFYTANTAQVLKKAKEENTSWSGLVGEAEDEFDREIDKIEKLLDDIDEKAIAAIQNSDLSKKEREKAEDTLALALSDAQRGISRRTLAFERSVEAIEGVGIFESFIDYEVNCLHNAIMAVRYLNFTGGIATYRELVKARRTAPMTLGLRSGLPSPTAVPEDEQPGLVFHLLMAAEGVRWFVTEHWIFAPIFLVWALALWALFGGAIHRIAAVQFARGETISMFQALSFSRQKFLSFFTAPLVPIAVILGVGLLLAAGGLIGSIPLGIGDLLLAVLFGIAIALGLAIAFMVVGLVAGLPLMYPVIAVEGSDNFDATSRSFSYVYNRPIRTIFYGGVACVYGVITYLFVRLFAFIALYGVHYFVKWGVIRWSDTGSGSALSNNADKLDLLWQKPEFWNLHQFNDAATGGWEAICAYIMAFWVYLLAGAVGAYVLTFFASSSTAIYYILRRRVDATDIDDVYVEEEEEEVFPAATTAAETTEEQPAEEKPAEEKKAETPAEEDKKPPAKKKAKKKASKKKEDSE
ncbi:MAG: hypothetical protein K8S55_12640 [Phycisphaerae bacterium]|nr:hypothetical protein [Phycisphaerae bacterium]